MVEMDVVGQRDALVLIEEKRVAGGIERGGVVGARGVARADDAAFGATSITGGILMLRS